MAGAFGKDAATHDAYGVTVASASDPVANRGKFGQAESYE
jgi:hypothetical protein